MLGDPRTNQNPAFLTLGILFYRWHNVLASRISQAHPKWTDEDVFQEGLLRPDCASILTPDFFGNSIPSKVPNFNLVWPFK